MILTSRDILVPEFPDTHSHKNTDKCFPEKVDSRGWTMLPL